MSHGAHVTPIGPNWIGTGQSGGGPEHQLVDAIDELTLGYSGKRIVQMDFEVLTYSRFLSLL